MGRMCYTGLAQIQKFPNASSSKTQLHGAAPHLAARTLALPPWPPPCSAPATDSSSAASASPRHSRRLQPRSLSTSASFPPTTTHLPLTRPPRPGRLRPIGCGASSRTSPPSPSRSPPLSPLSFSAASTFPLHPLSPSSTPPQGSAAAAAPRPARRGRRLLRQRRRRSSSCGWRRLRRQARSRLSKRSGRSLTWG